MNPCLRVFRSQEPLLEDARNQQWGLFEIVWKLDSMYGMYKDDGKRRTTIKNSIVIELIMMFSSQSAMTWIDTFERKGSRTVTTVTRSGGNPISSLASLLAVSTSSTSPSSAFPPGKDTSPEKTTKNQTPNSS